MKDEEALKELEKWLEDASEYSFPQFKELPDIPLNMDQVIYYINKVYGPISTEDNFLTAFMVHNYVKAEIIDEPQKKKYNEVHLGYLLAICMLKKTLSMNEISLLIDMDKEISTDASTLYRFFATMSNSMISADAEKLEKRVEKYREYADKMKETDPEGAETYFKDMVGLMALRLTVRSSVNQMLAKRLIKYLDETREKPIEKQVQKSAAKEVKKDKKKTKSEASKVAKTKKAKKA